MSLKPRRNPRKPIPITQKSSIFTAPTTMIMDGYDRNIDSGLEDLTTQWKIEERKRKNQKNRKWELKK